jgi:hypothetical protein
MAQASEEKKSPAKAVVVGVGSEDGLGAAALSGCYAANDRHVLVAGRAAPFLAADDASLVSGIELFVDGGRAQI